MLNGYGLYYTILLEDYKCPIFKLFKRSIISFFKYSIALDYLIIVTLYFYDTNFFVRNNRKFSSCNLIVMKLLKCVTNIFFLSVYVGGNDKAPVC